MSDDLKEAVRLLFECAGELQLHEEWDDHVTSQELKDKMLAFLAKHGMDDAKRAAIELYKEQP